MSTHPKTPKLLPWLAKKADISESLAATMWHDSERWAERRAPADSPAYYKLAVDHLLQLVAAESLREDVASFGLRPWARAQSRLWTVSMQLVQEISAVTTRGWTRLGSAAQLQQIG